MIGLRRNRPLALAAAFILFAGNLFAADIESTVDEIAAKFVGSLTPGLSIAIAQSDEVLLQKGYGLAHVEKQIPVEADTVFRTGSVTKQFTGVAIVQLSLAGKFGLDDEFTTVLKDYPATPKPITIRHLLHHTSGIPSFTGLPSYMPNMPSDVTHAELVARFSSLPLDFDPGTDWRYNNSGYYLLGMIVEAASGDRYADYLEAHLFGPAGMNHSDDETSATRLASPGRSA